jgi:hypothetical protein
MMQKKNNLDHFQMSINYLRQCMSMLVNKERFGVNSDPILRYAVEDVNVYECLYEAADFMGLVAFTLVEDEWHKKTKLHHFSKQAQFPALEQEVAKKETNSIEKLSHEIAELKKENQRLRQNGPKHPVQQNSNALQNQRSQNTQRSPQSNANQSPKYRGSSQKGWQDRKQNRQMLPRLDGTEHPPLPEHVMTKEEKEEKQKAIDVATANQNARFEAQQKKKQSERAARAEEQKQRDKKIECPWWLDPKKTCDFGDECKYLHIAGHENIKPDAVRLFNKKKYAIRNSTPNRWQK